MRKAAPLLTLLLLFCSGISKAQQTSVGVLLGAETVYAGWRPLAGLVAEHRKTKHSGFETGIQYRSLQLNFGVSTLIGTTHYDYTTTVNEHHLTLPFLYKYYSRIVNIAAGPTFDFYLGYSANATDPRVTVDNYTRTPTFDIGGLLKISKAINLSKGVLLEPEFRVNPLFNSVNTYVGFGIAAKHRLKAK